ncbi:hypothetical protein [Campylobacter sp. MIT 97-5078]|uniref:hypothetical protein n=1 Tax=Campylobacter sp. MIT 97-5078 TaxID=1548153 RepID=UPI0005132F7E|nr:hypothetical protein [Campylobacter sp. MIT 97-5078]KGI55587.1 hypothetical protein LR59_11320 [Campylobacter sp. MIT 97-5078]TQR27554.1 DUF829 domain-containing protein [Campylobacter sp. MIT 97-5078]
MQKRDIFYIAGYDPRGFRYYYLMFKKNLAFYEKMTQKKFILSKNKQEYEFHTSWSIQGENSQNYYHFLAWNDIVKANWHKNIFSILADAFDFFKIYVITGLFVRFAKACKAPLVAGFYPFFYVLFSYLFIFAFIFFSFKPIVNASHEIIAVIFSLLVLYFSSKLIFKIGNKTAAFWLLRICAFCSRWARGEIKDIDARTAEFAKIVFKTLKANARKENYELILCAHSVGTILIINVLADLIKQSLDENIPFDKLKVLTLGECVPLMSYHKHDNLYKQNLAFLAQFKLTWFDFTSKIDGACFYKVDFFKTSGIKDMQISPSFLSTHFYKLYSKEEYAKIRRDWYRAHFLYLEAGQHKGEYDFFAFVVDEKILEDKIKAR